MSFPFSGCTSPGLDDPRGGSSCKIFSINSVSVKCAKNLLTVAEVSVPFWAFRGSSKSPEICITGRKLKEYGKMRAIFRMGE